MPSILLTGGAGFFGDVLKRKLLQDGWHIVSIDLQPDSFEHPNFRAIQGDIRNRQTMEKLFTDNKFDAVFHLAAILAHDVKDFDFLWSCNVDGTKMVADCMVKAGVRKIIYTSSNCLWGEGMGKPVTEEDVPKPVEIYGQSKLEGEKILQSYGDKLDAVIFRCPTIIDSGRLGLLAILFEFIDEGRKVWVVGGGDNVYQFIYAEDLADAFVKAFHYPHGTIFHIGSDGVQSFRDMYNSVIERAHTGARVASLPRGPTLLAMRLCYKLGLSPLGPYQYKMIAESFVFDTTKMKRELKWQPTMSNSDMLWKAYEYYHSNRKEIENRKDVSSHKQAAKMGVIRVLKWIS